MIIAHQGGWDEILLVALPLGLFAVLLFIANRRAPNRSTTKTNRQTKPTTTSGHGVVTRSRAKGGHGGHWRTTDSQQPCRSDHKFVSSGHSRIVADNGQNGVRIQRAARNAL